MDSGTAITATTIVLVCIMPFVYMSINNKKARKQLIEKLNELAQNNHCTITHYDIVNSLAIGIDEASATIFFIKKMATAQIAQHVTLTEIQKCNVITTNKTIVEEGYHFKTLDKLELAFSHRNKSEAQIVMTFYEAYSADSATLSNEFQIADKWCKIANRAIEASAQKK